MRVHMWPSFEGEDQGEGGVRQVWEAMRASLPRTGVEFVDDPGDAELIACHIEIPETYLRRFPDKPIVAHNHGLYWSEYEWEKWAYEANFRVLKLVALADITTAPTEWVAQIIRRHTCRDVRVIPHGISLRDWKPAAEHRGYVLWNKTRIDPVCDVKPLNQLARAMPQQGFVSTYADDLPNVQVTGRLPHAAGKEIIRHAGVYLCTSRETFGVGTLEALASGVPVVGYNYGGQAEFITHGVDGWLVEPGDIDGLAEGVQWALANREEASVEARKKAAEYTWTNAATQYQKVYREAVNRHARKEDAPRVSIVVTAYKLEQWLPDTLDSVIAQTDPAWEAIVVDDASPDRCGEIADEYAARDPRIKVIHNKTNQYLAEARNVGIEAATAPYILPLDADDQLAPQAVRILADALDVDRTLDVAYGSVLFVHEDGRTPVDYGVVGRTPGHSSWPVPFSPEKQMQGFNLLPYASAFRKDAWRAVGGYRRRLKTSEDADFWTRLASYGYEARYVTEADTLIYRTRSDSMSVTNRAREKEYLRWYPWAKEPKLVPSGKLGAKQVSLNDPAISVVIPVGPGHARVVQDAVDSVVAQSYPKWEIIVVNDSGEELFLPPFVRVLTSDARDPAEARNIGVRAAKTKLYLPLDADDYLQPDALQWLLTAYVESDGEIIYSDFWQDVDEKGQFLPDGKWMAHGLDDWSCEKLITRGAIATVTALTPVAAWNAVGGYQSGMGWEDWDFQLRCAEAGFCSRRLAAPLFTYRKKTGLRAAYTPEEFTRRKAQMLERWKAYYPPPDGTGEKTMACSCSGRTIAPMTAPRGNAGAPSADGVVQVAYVGNRMGDVQYRGKSGTLYSFGAGTPPMYVLAEDAVIFEGRDEFQIMRGTPAGQQLAAAGPVL